MILPSAYVLLSLSLRLPTAKQMHLTSRAFHHNWDKDLKAMEARQRWAEIANAREGRVRHPRTQKFTKAQLREIARLGK
jgi:hypothetical protein